MEIETTSTRVVYENRWTRLREDTIVRQDGSSGLYAVVEKPNFSVIIPVTETGFWLVEQYRHPVDGRYLEFPMGADEANPTIEAETLARHELVEETGLRADKLTHLGHAFLAYGLANHGFDVFLASGLHDGEPNRSIEEQGMDSVHVTRKEFVDLVSSGRVQDSATLSAYSLLLIHEQAETL